ncbi:hypothetical protein JX265_006415 [Neoarthrinium moseri]|uniref:Uncharacterized protein n=1 Tax=Neoarthrinium moseri TaxID=1658444 RepID=A0A9Q0AR07_9PEZI|nr:uncharacterized protein JN550_008195 [Neoarthrinium moseri]KAI1865438.1 hypothetical protein JN550_008195 [Neoarthrinium moseri]KAI1870245.1 hypothetical protein JX265_006415 [Neoarthrinium moseri]
MLCSTGWQLDPADPGTYVQYFRYLNVPGAGLELPSSPSARYLDTWVAGALIGQSPGQEFSTAAQAPHAHWNSRREIASLHSLLSNQSTVNLSSPPSTSRPGLHYTTSTLPLVFPRAPMSPAALGMSTAVRRPALAPRQGPVCLICDALTVRRPNRAKAAFTTRSVSRPRPLLLRAARGTSLGVPTTTEKQRWLASATSGRSRQSSAAVQQTVEETQSRRSSTPTVGGQELMSLTNMLAYVENSKSKVTNHRGIPSEKDVAAALQACKVVADYITDESLRPQISHMVNELDSTASNLLSLDASSRKASRSASQAPVATAGGVGITAQLKQLIDKISQAAYETVAHPTVFITPSLLQQYVHAQASLNRPETLPRVFQMYASKPMAREESGSIQYTKPNPNKAAHAIDPKVAETALDSAIEAKNLDAAVGIIENSYTTPAFIRSKLLRKGLAPGITFAATPVAAYALARSFSVFQDAMDTATATNVAFAGILAYVGFTASIGIVSATTANDQMKRVTWAPGVALRMRWIREEERAALDRVACAWGFSEKWRQGEEEGPEWDSLREYIGQKGMVLDRTELMEGME